MKSLMETHPSLVENCKKSHIKLSSSDSNYDFLHDLIDWDVGMRGFDADLVAEAIQKYTIDKQVLRDVIRRCVFESKQDGLINQFKTDDEGDVISVDLIKLEKELGLGDDE